MIKTFLEKDNIAIVNNVFGTFYYDIDTNRSLPKKYFFDKVIAKEALFIIDSVFKEEKVTFFLIFGTCLGAMREKAFIDHDIDIDLGVYYHDKASLIEAIKVLQREFNFKISKISQQEESISIVYKDIIIDIGIFQRKGKVYRYNDFHENKIPRKFLDTLEEISFLGKKFYVPADTKNYLRFQYGRTWNKIEKNWRSASSIFHAVLTKIKNIVVKRYLWIRHLFKEYSSYIKFKYFNQFNEVINQHKIKDIQKVWIGGQGFCDTYVVYASKNIVIKENIQNRFLTFKKEFEKVEPIYAFLEYKDRFLYEKDIFKKVNGKDVEIKNNIIIFPYLHARLMSDFLEKDEFYHHLSRAFLMLKELDIRHGDFHIDNILVANDGRIHFIDFEMTFGSYLSTKEQYYYDIYYFFAKLEYQYSDFYRENFVSLKEFVKENFSQSECEEIMAVVDKTKKYFFTINGARIDLFS